jgi:hypothetical protein
MDILLLVINLLEHISEVVDLRVPLLTVPMALLIKPMVTHREDLGLQIPLPTDLHPNHLVEIPVLQILHLIENPHPLHMVLIQMLKELEEEELDPQHLLPKDVTCKDHPLTRILPIASHHILQHLQGVLVETVNHLSDHHTILLHPITVTCGEVIWQGDLPLVEIYPQVLDPECKGLLQEATKHPLLVKRQIGYNVPSQDQARSHLGLGTVNNSLAYQSLTTLT